MPTRTQQGDLLLRAYASHGDTRHIALPGRSRRVLHHGRAGVRPGGALPDAGVRAVGPRHRHERLDVPAADAGTTATGRTAARCWTRSSWRRWTVLPATWTWTATASRRARCPACTRRARTSPAAPGTTYGDYTEDADAYREVVDRLARKLDGRRGGGAAAGGPHRATAPRSGSSPSAGATRRCARRWTGWPPGAWPRTTCASAASRSARRSSVPAAPPDTFVVEQNRDAQLRSLLILETGVAASGCALHPRLRRDAAQRAPSSRRHRRRPAPPLAPVPA
jgi:2-oxoglutarate/2-oxoacid ferredoxin oxidoreductase subunit alpha